MIVWKEIEGLYGFDFGSHVKVDVDYQEDYQEDVVGLVECPLGKAGGVGMRNFYIHFVSRMYRASMRGYILDNVVEVILVGGKHGTGIRIYHIRKDNHHQVCCIEHVVCKEMSSIDCLLSNEVHEGEKANSIELLGCIDEP